MICDKYFRLYDKSGNGTELVFEEIDLPVRRGRWEKRPVGDEWYYCCTECDTCFCDVGYGWEYCPICGAKMDGGEE